MNIIIHLKRKDFEYLMEKYKIFKREDLEKKIKEEVLKWENWN